MYPPNNICCVREASPRDTDIVVRMIAAGAQFHAFLDQDRFRNPPVSQLTATLRPLLSLEANLDGGLLLVAERAGVLAGTALIQRRNTPQRMLRRAETILHITWMWVDEQFRGQGVAAAILTEIERRARAAGVARIETDVSGFNSASKTLFDRRGYFVATVVYAWQNQDEAEEELC